MKTVLLFLLPHLISTVSSVYMPIPRREVGFVFMGGSATAPVHLDAYLDITCPGCKEAFPHLLDVANYYGPRVLQLTTHVFPLPYHRTAFNCAKATHIVNSLTDLNTTYDWINLVFNNNDNLTSQATFKLSDEQVIGYGKVNQDMVSMIWGVIKSMLAKLASQFGISEKTFQALYSDQTIKDNTRVAWKYCCTRGVSGTPTFMLNDVVVDADLSWGVKEWQKMIDPLLK